GTLLSLALAVVWVFLRDWWSGIVPDDPGRELAAEINQSLRASARHLRPVRSALGWARALLKPRDPNEPFAEETPQDDEGAKQAGRTVCQYRSLMRSSIVSWWVWWAHWFFIRSRSSLSNRLHSALTCPWFSLMPCWWC